MKKTQETAQDHINNLEKELDATKLKLEVKEEEIKALSSIRKPFDLPKEENGIYYYYFLFISLFYHVLPANFYFTCNV